MDSPFYILRNLTLCEIVYYYTTDYENIFVL